MAIFRGTTPVETWSINADLREARIYITYQQNGKNIIEKTNEDMKIGEDYIVYTLSQEDTLRLDPDYPVLTQIRWVFENGMADTIELSRRSVGRILRDGVIKWEK